MRFARGLADDGQERTMQKGNLEESGESAEWERPEDSEERDDRSDKSCVQNNAVSDAVNMSNIFNGASSISRDSCVSARRSTATNPQAIQKHRKTGP